MKIIFFYLVVLAFFSLGTVYGQFQVTSYFNPRTGETQRLIYSDTAGISPGGGGPNQTWSFPGVMNIGDSSIHSYVLPSATPYGGNFPTATIADIKPSNPDEFAYFSGTSSYFEFVGFQDSTYKTVFSDPMRFRNYPFSYPGSFTDNFKAITYQGTNIVNKITGTMTVTYDGYGTLNLPSGTATNVGRFKFVTYEIDTLTFGSNTFVEYIKDTTWRWAKSNYRYSLFEIEKKWISMNGISYSGTKQVKFVPNINWVGVKTLSNEIPSGFKLEQNYPNPFNPNTNIIYQVPHSTNVLIKIYDRLGREVETLLNRNQNAGVYEISWDASAFSSGVYYCRMIADGFSATKQIVLIK